MDTESFRAVLGGLDLKRSTDDILAAALPLLHQVLAAHERGQVAPLDGVEHLASVGGRLFFENARCKPPTLAPGRLAEIERDEGGALQVVAHKRSYEDDDERRVEDLSIVERGAPITRPVHLVGFVSWEHEVGHHDALTDVYVLGLVLASLALDQDLGDEDALAGFVAGQRDVRRTNDRIHPVVARVIEQMTDPRRRARLQDLRTIIDLLQHHREQRLPDPIDLAQIHGLVERTPASRRGVICGRLRGRLFDLSRRNRLLYFRASAQSLDLTEISVPLVLRIESIADDALLTCSRAVVDQLARLAPMPLGKWVRFEDYPFAAAALDKLRTTAARARAEYGVSSLKLALCFLHWHDLKKAPAERIHTPLLLVPVELTRKKGVRDTHVLQATSELAEVNPVLRHVLAQTYGIQLPEAVNLAEEGSVEALHRVLVDQIQSTEPGVAVDLVERPAIELIHARVRRRLDAFRKRAQISGRGVRARDGIDYSYRHDNFQPLGLRLFTMRVVPSEAPSAGIYEAPRPRAVQMAPDPLVRELETQVYSLRRGGDEGGAHRWAFDLTMVTLGNFDHQRMSLVRDYDTLLEGGLDNRAFDALFSTDPRPPPVVPAAPAASELYPVVATDSTQTATVVRARDGDSFIVQGPPGTGKSQTITNLIADYVARGKRVLFVCEKRAAIDVVYHRLRQLGLDRLTTLIHDSQADKRPFVASLKDSYEAWMAPTEEAADPRAPALAALLSITSELERFDALMTAQPPDAAAPLVHILRRSCELRGAIPALSPRELERLPTHRAVGSARDLVDSLARILVSLGEEPVLARHPARLLSERVLDAERPVELVTRAVARIVPALDRAEVSPTLPLRAAIERAALALRIRPLASARLLALLDESDATYRAFAKKLSTLAAKATEVAAAVAKAARWRSPITRDDLGSVVALARAWHGKIWRFLFPSFWRLRRILRERFDFAAHLVPPSYVEALALLATRYEAEDALAREKTLVAAELGVDDLDATTDIVEGFHAKREWSEAERDLRRELKSPGAPAMVEELARAAPALDELARELSTTFVGHDGLTLEQVRCETTALGQRVGSLLPLARALLTLRAQHPAVAEALRDLPLSPDALEAAVGERTIERALREDPAAARLTGPTMAELRDQLDARHADFRRANAAHVVAAAKRRFLEHVRVATSSAAALDRDEKSFKRDYAAGRRDLEHEMGKVMRFKSIRELMTGKSGLVVRDLKPVWLMSPLSVADTLPLSTDYFDVVVFDEASQIPLEDAIPAIHRAAQCIVVGDDKQLPPTNFFGASQDDEDALTFEERGATVSMDLDADSLLAHAARTLPSTMLGWHYRSRDESLIQFSNKAFYDGKLATIPTPARVVPRSAIRATAPEQGAEGARALLERAISYHRLDGVYAARTNRLEAEYIAHLVRELLRQRTGASIGIVAFSEAQQEEIEGALRRLTESDAEFRAALDAETERTEDDQFCGLFVKNLENVQGDERDVIILSICYGPDADGKMRMNFGPINQRGGEKRLNVIFSRARRHLAVVSSIDDVHITNDYNDGANTLRCYLRYAAAMSRGDEADARAALRAIGPREESRGEGQPDPVVQAVARALREAGLEVEENVGGSSFRCDLAVRRPGDSAHRVAVLVDTDAHYAAPSDERHRVKPSLLRAFGWRLETVLARDWRASPEEAVTRIRRAVDAPSG